MSDKRSDYISWDEYFMGVAMLSGMRSKDPNTQVGACIVSPDHKILSMGYNGMPRGCHDTLMPWAREGEPQDTKYMFVCHAELNAILSPMVVPSFSDEFCEKLLFELFDVSLLESLDISPKQPAKLNSNDKIIVVTTNNVISFFIMYSLKVIRDRSLF